MNKKMTFRAVKNGAEIELSQLEQFYTIANRFASAHYINIADAVDRITPYYKGDMNEFSTKLGLTPDANNSLCMYFNAVASMQNKFALSFGDALHLVNAICSQQNYIENAREVCRKFSKDTELLREIQRFDTIERVKGMGTEDKKENFAYISSANDYKNLQR